MHHHLSPCRWTPYLNIALVLAAVLTTPTAEAGPGDSGRTRGAAWDEAVHDADHSVDQAWEIFHRAAVGGTIASPALQTDIEQHLHEARRLLTQAYAAVEHDDPAGIELILADIAMHTKHAITGSMEHKP